MKSKKKFKDPKKYVKKTEISRKARRKELRRLKKLRKKEFFINRKKLLPNKNLQIDSCKVRDIVTNVKEPEEGSILQARDGKKVLGKSSNNFQKICNIKKNNFKEIGNESLISLDIIKEQELEKKLKLQMEKQRIKQLVEANKEEDKTIRRLEKQLGIKKKKTNTIQKSLIASGLDYILEVCDSKKVKAAAAMEQSIIDSDTEFNQDMNVISANGENKIDSATNERDDKKIINENLSEEYESDEFSEFKDHLTESEIESNDENKLRHKNVTNEIKLIIKKNEGKSRKKVVKFHGIAKSGSDSDEVLEDNVKINENPIKRKCNDRETEKNDLELENENFEDEGIIGKSLKENRERNTWEDIYGRTRDTRGNIIQNNKGKYIPPHLRVVFEISDEKKQELLRLKREIQGLLNRLSENNMLSISNQIDEMFMRNSRNDMNETLSGLIMEALVTQTITPERLIIEHSMLVAILHSNIGTEIGAYMLQVMVKRFYEIYSSSEEHLIENKTLDNIMLIICHLYTFRIFNCGLLYDLMSKLCERFGEKEVDLIINILRSVGFPLRKDDPVALKNFLLRVQKLAAESELHSQSRRVKFMLDILLTIKNNNMTKLPQYDPTLGEHLKKLLKPMLRKGNFVTELRITLDDLLKADEKGKWWVIGSAWTGGKDNQNELVERNEPSISNLSGFSLEVLELAKRQRMNTPNRRNIFCILMTAEDYLDAFEKLLKLGLKGQPEQEIIHVLIHCLLQEKDYNPYYSHVASQLCISDRKHQLTIQYSVWDRIKDLKTLKSNQVTNLAKFLGHLFLDKSVPISVLKVIHFAELDKPSVRFLRQTLLTVFMAKESRESLTVFTRISASETLAIFKESLRLFFHHFILKNLTDLTIKERVVLADEALLPSKTSSRATSSSLSF